MCVLKHCLCVCEKALLGGWGLARLIIVGCEVVRLCPGPEWRRGTRLCSLFSWGRASARDVRVCPACSWCDRLLFRAVAVCVTAWGHSCWRSRRRATLKSKIIAFHVRCCGVHRLLLLCVVAVRRALGEKGSSVG